MIRPLDTLWELHESIASRQQFPPLLMGVVNVTPDSFSDGGQYQHREAAVLQALRLIGEGADIIDIGGESTRPPGRDYGEGAARISAGEELERVIPVIEAIRREYPGTVISIDTMKPDVAAEAVNAGAGIINDVSAGRYDDAIFTIAATHDIPYILMHGHDPANLAAVDQIAYDDVVGDVFRFLHDRIAAARQAGVRRVIADVGIGFAKHADQSARLIREHRRFLELNVPLLVGASRKSFIGRMLGGLPPQERLFGTLAAHAVAAFNGASIVRVHDIRPAREFFTVLGQLMPAGPSQ